MSDQQPGAARAITDYFNSTAYNAPQESALLASIMVELMQAGKSASNKAIIANIIDRLERLQDDEMLKSCRNLLAQMLENSHKT